MCLSSRVGKQASIAMREEGEKEGNRVDWKASGDAGWLMEDGTWEAGTKWAFPPERGSGGSAGPAWDEEVQMVSTLRAILGYMMLVGDGERRTREAAKSGAEDVRKARGKWRGIWKEVMREVVREGQKRATTRRQREAQERGEKRAAEMDDRPSKRAVGRERRRMVSYDETPRRTKKRRDREHTQSGERGGGEEPPRTQQRCKIRKREEGIIPGGGAAGVRTVARMRKEPTVGRVLTQWMGRDTATVIPPPPPSPPARTPAALLR